MFAKSSLVEDRKNLVNLVNEEVKDEGYHKVEATGKAFISSKGIVWHELVFLSSENSFNYITSFPFYGRSFTRVWDTEEAEGMDEEAVTPF